MKKTLNYLWYRREIVLYLEEFLKRREKLVVINFLLEPGFDKRKNASSDDFMGQKEI